MNTANEMRFLDRANSLFDSQRRRSQQKRGPSGRISKKGYALPFDRKQFFAWFLKQFNGNPDEIIHCPYCRVLMDIYNCVVDHMVPLKRGGLPGLDNLQLICDEDNQIKGGLTADEYRWFRDSMDGMLKRFGNGEAVSDINSRLQKAVKLAAMARRNISKGKKA